MADSGLPANSVIDSIFAGADMAVERVAGIVQAHQARLDAPCGWATQLAQDYRTLDRQYSTAMQTARQLASKGATAIASALADGGFGATGHKYNPGSIQSFGAWLEGRGYVTTIGGLVLLPGAPFFPPPYYLVRRGEPRKTPGGLNLGGGVYIYPNTASGKLSGPTIWQEWREWAVAMKAQIQPKGAVYGPRGGWRGVLAGLTGDPDWRIGDPVAPDSKAGLLVTRRDMVGTMRAQADYRCAQSGGAPPVTGAPPAGGGIGPLLLAGLLLWRRRRG